MIHNVADLFFCLNDVPEILYAMRSPKSFEDPDCKDLIVEGCENVEKWLIDNQNATEAATKRAIKEIVEPFVKEHPDFVW